MVKDFLVDSGEIGNRNKQVVRIFEIVFQLNRVGLENLNLNIQWILSIPRKGKTKENIYQYFFNPIHNYSLCLTAFPGRSQRSISVDRYRIYVPISCGFWSLYIATCRINFATIHC